MRARSTFGLTSAPASPTTRDGTGTAFHLTATLLATLVLGVRIAAASDAPRSCGPFEVVGDGGGTAGMTATFTRVGPASGFTCNRGGGTTPPAWGDYDGDGYLDLPIYRNDGDGTFSDIPGFRTLLAGASYHGAAWGDYDNDGRLDLAILPYGTGATLLLHNEGDGTFRDVAPELGMNVEGFGETAAWGDYDGDGWLDLFAPFYSYVEPFQSFLYRNNRDGTFTDVSHEAGVALAALPAAFRPEGAHWADWNEDGLLDLYVAHHLFENDGRGGFVDVREMVGLPKLFDEGSMFVDYDNDGDLDLWLRPLDRGRLFRNDCGAFNEVTSQAGIPALPHYWGDTWVDVDHDGLLDLLYMRRDGPALLLVNQGDGTFAEDLGFTAADFRGDNSAWGDYDNDGDLDLVLGAGCHHLVRNDLDGSPDFAHSYLRVEALDPAGRQNMHGSTVRLTRLDEHGHGTQTRVVDGGSGYLSQSQYAAQFGVKGDGRYALEVRFPASRPGEAVVGPGVNPALDDISPHELADKRIVVFRDGRVILDGETFGPLATPTPTASPTPTTDPTPAASATPTASPAPTPIRTPTVACIPTHALAGSHVRALASAAGLPDLLYAGGQGGVFRTVDGGATWEAAAQGLPDDAPVVALAVDPRAPNIAYAGTLGAGLYRTRDAGLHWKRMARGLTATTITAIAVDPADSGTVYAAGPSGVFKSTSRGRKWKARSSGLEGRSASTLAIAATSPSTLYVGLLASGGVYTSLDGARTWLPTSPRADGPAVHGLAIHPAAPGTLYAAADLDGDPATPADGAILKTTDGGTTWAEPAIAALPGRAVRAVSIDPQQPRMVYAARSGDAIRTTNSGRKWRVMAALRGRTAEAIAIHAARPDRVHFATDSGVFTWCRP